MISIPTEIKSNGTHITLSSGDESAFDDLLTAADACEYNDYITFVTKSYYNILHCLQHLE